MTYSVHCYSLCLLVLVAVVAYSEAEGQSEKFLDLSGLFNPRPYYNNNVRPPYGNGYYPTNYPNGGYPTGGYPYGGYPNGGYPNAGYPNGGAGFPFGQGGGYPGSVGYPNGGAFPNYGTNVIGGGIVPPYNNGINYYRSQDIRQAEQSTASPKSPSGHRGYN